MKPAYSPPSTKGLVDNLRRTLDSEAMPSNEKCKIELFRVVRHFPPPSKETAENRGVEPEEDERLTNIKRN